MEQTLTIIRTNGETSVIESSSNMWVLGFIAQSPSYQTKYETIEGLNGEIATGTRIEGRVLKADIAFRSADVFDFYLFRNTIFELLDSGEAFHIISSREPGKRWYVRVSDTYEIKPYSAKYGVFSVTFKSESSYCESVGTTMDPFTTDSGVWQMGQGLIENHNMVYTHSTTTFNIYNAGTRTIDPRSIHTPLVITYTGASSNLKIKNNTTNEEWSYAGSSLAGDDIVLDGVESSKNGVDIFGSTNYKLITLKPGQNSFTLTGTSGGFSISFNHRFYYL